MSKENSAEWLRGAVAVLGRMVDDCSTVFDSDLPHITQSNLEDYLAEYAALLSAAEAREAGKVSAESAALARIHSIASRQLAEPAGAGDAVAMAKICTEVEAVGLQKPTHPTAAEVIAGAKKAAHRIYWDHEDAEDMEREAKELLASLAAWEAAQR
jgi:hypothetical protein